MQCTCILVNNLSRFSPLTWVADETVGSCLHEPVQHSIFLALALGGTGWDGKQD